ncbi:metacaspase [Skeletonema marinoi]|uniref:Metacaspase n=1 Tax=Skeletonema marinoi TaxID=267567 RepID=A0AAD8XW97_9STRA|nr:metacaspase [Skeletonema marinoi]
MSEKRRPSSSRGKPPPPPPPRRQSSSAGQSKKAELTIKSSSSTRREARSVKSHANSKSRRDSQSRSKSRPRDDSRNSKPRDKSRSRSKSRPRSSPRNNENDTQQRRSKSKSSSSRSKPPQSKGTRSKSSPRSGTPHGKSSSSSSSSNKGNKAQAESFNAKKRQQKFASQAKKAIPTNIRMISGSHDMQTSADVGNINAQFELPNPAGRAGGACTAALLQVLYDAHDRGDVDMSWVDALREMREILHEKGFDQIPQLSSSRMIDVCDPFVITPESFDPGFNKQRAVLIGINYKGQKGQLSGCHNDVHNVTQYLKEVQGFKDENITILMDDGMHKPPTKSAIISAFKRLVKQTKEGDVVFCQYSGHGGRLPDDNGDEDDGYDETLIPLDFQKSGHIRDDDLLKILIHPMPAKVTMTCLMDSCHSGTVLDLPYRFVGDGDHVEMEMNDRVNFTEALWSGLSVAAGVVAGNAIADAVNVAPEMMILGGGPNAIHEHSDTACCAVS